MFGVGSGKKLTAKEIKRRSAAAEKHGACFIHGTDPGKTDGYGNQSYRWWYAAPNRGEPFDSGVRKSVEAELAT